MLADDSPELRAVVPLLVSGQLVGAGVAVWRGAAPCVLASTELQAPAGSVLHVAPGLVGGATRALAHRGSTTSSAIDSYAVAGTWSSADIQPVDSACIAGIERIYDGSQTLVAFAQHGARIDRVQISVSVGTWQFVSSRPRSDDADCFEATSRDPLPPGTCWVGAPIIVKAPAQRALDLPARTMICALAVKLGFTRTEPKPLASLRSFALPRG